MKTFKMAVIAAEEKAADAVEGAIANALAQGKARTPDIGRNGKTKELTDAIVSEMEKA
jgi:isocitrate/isopropylmalate dehydrogenase